MKSVYILRVSYMHDRVLRRVRAKGVRWVTAMGLAAMSYEAGSAFAAYGSFA